MAAYTTESNPELNLWLMADRLFDEIETEFDPTSRYRQYQDDIVSFVKNEMFYRDSRGRLINYVPDEHQEKILLSVQNNVYTAVKSGHGIGKTICAAWSLLWFLMTHQDSLVVTSAPTQNQVEQVLWRGKVLELIQNNQDLKELLEIRTTSINLKGHTGWMAVGRTSNKPDNLQGFHAPYLLLILDEAPGIEEDIIQAVMGTLTTDAKCLLIGNPTRNEGYFYDCFHSKRSMWNTLTVSSIISPQVSNQWIDDRREDWGNGTPIFQARVLGEFPDQAEDQLIPLSWIERAEDLDFIEFDPTKRVLSSDIASMGNDLTTIFIIDIDEVRKLYKIVEVLHYFHMDVMQVTGRIIDAYNNYSPSKIFVDAIGLGEGVEARLREQGYPVEGIKAGSKPTDDKANYLNMKSQGYWFLRKAFESNSVSIPKSCKKLSGELSSMRFEIRSDGKIKIIDPLKSPDFADGLMLGIVGLYASPVKYSTGTLANLQAAYSQNFKRQMMQYRRMY